MNFSLKNRVKPGPCMVHVRLVMIINLILLLNLMPAMGYFDGGDTFLGATSGTRLQQKKNDLFHAIHTRSNHRYCGKTLINVLKLVCRGAYNGPKPTVTKSPDSKKRLNSFVDSPETSKNLSAVPSLNRDPTVTMAPGQGPEPSSSSSTTRRYRRGIVDDCCINACTLTELISYCK